MKKRISYVIFLVSLLTLTVLCGCDKSRKKQRIRNRLRKKRQTGKRTIR